MAQDSVETSNSAIETTDSKSEMADPNFKSLNDLKKMFDDYRATSATNRDQGLIDIDYYDGKQLTVEEKKKLSDRGQPDIIINRCRAAINGTLGVIATAKTDPKCWPRNDQDEDAASTATDCIRYVTQKNKFNRLKVPSAKDYFLGGTTGFLIGIDANKDVTLERLRWEEIIIDPRARENDARDARYLGIAKWMFIDDVQEMYPAHSDDLENTTEGGSGVIGAIDQSFEDRPIAQGWIDIRNKRCMVVELYFKNKGKWYKAVYYYGGILEQGLSPYLNEYGKPDCPIIVMSCYVDRDNNRYGMMRDMRDIQDEINKRRSKLLHTVNSSQIQAEDPSAVEVDTEAARTEAARPDGVIPYGWKKVPTSDIAQGQQILLTEAKNEMERFGPNPAILGRQGADSSGKAIASRQQSGLIELAVVLDQLTWLEEALYEKIWARVKQYWDAPRVIRVTDDEDAVQFVGINQPIPNPNAGQPVISPSSGQQMVDPESKQPMVQPDVLGYTNSPANAHVDIEIDSTAQTSSIMQEQFKDLMDLVGTNPTYSTQVPFTLFIELMPGMPRKRQLIKKLEAYAQQQQQAQQADQERQHQQQEALIQAKIEDMASKGQLNQALANKAVGDTHATAARTATQTSTALADATIAHEETNINRYKAITEAAAKLVEKDDAGASS